MTTDADLDSADDLVEDDADLPDEDLSVVYDAQTERLKVYATLLRVTVPKIGATARVEFGKEAEIDPDVCSARNLASMAIFADIRRIAGVPGIAAHPDLP